MIGEEPIVPRRSTGLARSNSRFRHSILLPVNLEPTDGIEVPRRRSFNTDFRPASTNSEFRNKNTSAESLNSNHSDDSKQRFARPQSANISSTGLAGLNLSSSPRKQTHTLPTRPQTFKNGNSANDNNNDFIIRRIQQSKQLRSAEAERETQNGLKQLQRRFSDKQSAMNSPLIGTTSSPSNEDWEFWTSVVTNYGEVAVREPVRLRKAIQRGFPQEIRGILWQVIAGSKSAPLEQLYDSLIYERDIPCETAINKDINRTPMSGSVNKDSLARVLKAYSLFDAEVGYTQGMAFIVVPLLMELSEPECFSLFVQLMKIYDFRSMFVTDMPGLHLKLYQFERMLEDGNEPLSTHLRRQGIHPTMYASQWFITLFSYRFPPSLVERIFDIVIAEGLDALLRFAVALMKEGTTKILELKGIDEILPYLKDRIFDRFLGNENELVRCASETVLVPQALAKYEQEYSELTRVERERSIQLETLRNSNVRLTTSNRELETRLEELNQEHVQLANKLVKGSIEIANLKGANQELQEKIDATRADHDFYGTLDSTLKSQENTIKELQAKNRELQDEVNLLKQSEKVKSVSKLLKELKAMEETKDRYEQQLGSLQESLISALEGR